MKNQVKGRGVARGVRAVTRAGLAVIKGGAKVKEDSLPGEIHGILRMPNGSYERASYMGPGTQLTRRLRRGDPGKTMVDKISKRHDIDYSLAKTPAAVREADKRMVASVKQAIKNKSDDMFNLRQGQLIIPKIFAEKKTGKTFFNDMKGVAHKAEEKFLQRKRK